MPPRAVGLNIYIDAIRLAVDDLLENRFASQLIFHGPPGSGKTTLVVSALHGYKGQLPIYIVDAAVLSATEIAGLVTGRPPTSSHFVLFYQMQNMLYSTPQVLCIENFEQLPDDFLYKLADGAHRGAAFVLVLTTSKYDVGQLLGLRVQSRLVGYWFELEREGGVAAAAEQILQDELGDYWYCVAEQNGLRYFIERQLLVSHDLGWLADVVGAIRISGSFDPVQSQMDKLFNFSVISKEAIILLYFCYKCETRRISDVKKLVNGCFIPYLSQYARFLVCCHFKELMRNGILSPEGYRSYRINCCHRAVMEHVREPWVRDLYKELNLY